MSIKVHHITKCFGTQKALNNVTFAVDSGYVTGFLGPNGAGKSTMMKILTGYWSPDEGEAYICGEKVTGKNLITKGMVGYLPEHNPLYTEMYVREYLLMIAGIYKIRSKQAKARIEELIALTGLESEQHKRIEALSKGYRQRVGLAQALIQDPPVLILDEPTTGLDPNQIVEIRNLISELGRNKTVMLSSHILQEVKAICSRAIIVNRGKLVADEQVDATTGITGKKFHINIETKESASPELFQDLEGVLSVKESDFRNKKIITASKDIRDDIFTSCISNNIAIRTLSLEEYSLEDLFHQATH